MGAAMNCDIRIDPAAEQCWVEHKSLNHIKAALRVMLDWKVPSIGVPRKLSSVRFVMQSFQRHLERLMNLEEEGGYLGIVSEAKPHWCPKVEVLRSEHDQFRAAMRDLVPEIQSLCQDDEQRLLNICDEIGSLLRCIDRHDQKEAELLQAALTLDEGGEG